MLKSSLLNSYSSVKTSWIAIWITLSLLVPLILFVLLIVFETEMAGFIRSISSPTEIQGDVFYLDIVYLMRTEILWLGFFLLLASALACLSEKSLNSFFDIRLKGKALFYMMITATTFFFATILVSTEILEEFPNSADEFAYLFQADMFAAGKLWERAHDLPDFFHNNHLIQFEGIRLSRFPPGWPLLLSQAIEIGMEPSLVNPILALITLTVIYFFARRYYGDLVAIWTLLITAFSSYYIFNAASFFSHTSCLLVTVLFVFSLRLYDEKNSLLYGVLAGFFLGFALIIRYYTAVLVFLPFLVWTVAYYRFRAIRLFALMGLGGLPCLLYLLWYNYSITGHAFIPVTVWAYPLEQLGFVKGHSLLKGVEHWVRWILMFFYWAGPGLIVLYFVFLARKASMPSKRLMNVEDYMFLSLFIGYFFYYEIGGNQYGPRFMFEAFPFVVLFVVRKVLEMRERVAMAVLVAGLVYAIVRFPFISYREEDIVDQRQDVYDLVKEENIDNAVVLITAPTSPIRPMPADDLTRNDRLFANEVLYALELPRALDQLMEYYPERSFYRYVKDNNQKHGRLVRIR